MFNIGRWGSCWSSWPGCPAGEAPQAGTKCGWWPPPPSARWCSNLVHLGFSHAHLMPACKCLNRRAERWRKATKCTLCKTGFAKCPFWGQVIGTKGHNSHKNVHFRPFPCIECEETFSCRRKLDKHIELIHNGLIECCEHCGKEFSVRTSLNQHLRKVHKHQWLDVIVLSLIWQ